MSEEPDLEKLFEAVITQLDAEPGGPKLAALDRKELMEAVSHPLAASEIQRGMALEATSVQEGEPAFDFTLPRLQPGGEAGGAVTLSDHFGKRPVALVFGSYT